MSTHEYRLIATSKSADELVKHDRVDVSLYNDPALFDAELEKIFYRTWVWVAHESEVRNSGDFKTATIGRRPVIVVRDKKNNINVLENRCRHRGATVCEKHKGNATGFTCLVPQLVVWAGWQAACAALSGRLRRHSGKVRTAAHQPARRKLRRHGVRQLQR